MMNNWVSFEERIPEVGRLIMIREPRIALARLNEDKKILDVQPFKTNWYQTDLNNIDEWAEVTSMAEPLEIAIYQVLTEVFKDLHLRIDEE